MKSGSGKDKTPQWVAKGPNLVTYAPTGTYFGRAKVDGKLQYESLQTTDRQIADRRHLKFMERIRKARNRSNASKKTASNSKFKDLFNSYRKDIAEDPSLKPASKVARINSLIRIEKTWPDLLGMRPSRLKKSDVVKWIRNLASIGSGFLPPGASVARAGNSESSVRKSIQTLSRIMEAAVEDGLAAENVVKKASKERKLSKGKKADDAYIPSRDELEAIASEISKGPGGSGREFALRFLAYSGCRIEEAKSIVWDDIDFNSRELQIKGTKTEASNRVIPMNSTLVTLLTQRQAVLRKTANSKELKQIKILPVATLNKQIAAACLTLGIPSRRKEGQRDSITNHSLRHYFATTCLDKGVAIPTVSKWLGHNDGGSLLLKVYNHYLEDKGKAVADALSFDD